MPRMSRKTQRTINAIAAKHGVKPEEVLAHIDKLLSGRGVSKHRGWLTDTRPIS
jgi:hypothetical protein